MASGSFNGTFSGTSASNVYPRIEWSSTSSIANNTSSVTAVLYFVKVSSYWKPFNLSGHSAAISINGSSASANRKFDLRNSSKYEVWRRTVTVAHNADGRKSITISASSGSTGVSLGSYSISGTANLDTIPRASTFITDKNTYEMDSSVTMKITAAASGFTHKVWINFGSKRIQVLNNPATGVNVNFTPKLSDFADQIANATSGNGSFELETYNGSTKIGSYKQTRYLTIPASVVPTTSAVSISEGNTKVGAVLGDGVNFVQGMSVLNLYISAAGILGSWITASETVIGSTTYPSTTNNGRSVTIDLGGQQIAPAQYTVKVRTKDSRGQWSAYLTKNITIWPYTVPRINATVERVNNTTQLKFTKSATVSSIKIGTTEKNTYTATTDYKLSSDTAWTNAKTESNAFATVTIDGFAIDKSYDIRLTITDKFTSTSTVTTISTSKVLLDFYRDVGVGIGKLYEPGHGALDVGGDVTINDGLLSINSSSQSVKLSAEDGLSQHNNLGFSTQITPSLISMNSPSQGGTLTAENVSQINNIGELLWEGSLWMQASHTVTPSTPISKCLNGWVLVWSQYNQTNNTVGNAQWNYTYIQKTFVTNHSGMGVSCTWNNDTGKVIFKYIYVRDTYLTGYVLNANGDQRNYVLREVRSW